MNILPKVFFLTLFILYIIARYVYISGSKDYSHIDFTLDGVDYNMPHEIYYDKNNDYQYISANIIDYDPKKDLFTIMLIDATGQHSNKLQVTRDKIKTLSGEKYIYYPIKSHNRGNELIGFYSSIIAFLLCYIYISFSILNENTYRKIITNTIQFNSVYSTIIHEYSHMFLQIVLLMTLICFIYFYKDKFNTYSFITKDWHSINIILTVLNIYLFCVYQTPISSIETNLNRMFPKIDNSQIINVLITISGMLMLMNTIRHYAFHDNYLGYYPYGLAFITIGLLIKYIFSGVLKNPHIVFSAICLIFNVYHTNSLQYDIFFTLLGFNIINIISYLLNYNKYNYRHIISITLCCYLIILLKNTGDDFVYKMTSG